MSEQLTEGPLAKMFGPKPAAERPVDDRIRDLELRLDAVRAQRDAAVQQSLDHAATVAVLRRRADSAEGWRRSARNAERLIERIKSGELAWSGTEWVKRADRIGYCDSTFTPPDGGEPLACALDAGHRTNLHRDASLRYAWDDNAKAPGSQDPTWTCGKCERAERLGEDDGQIPEHHRTCPKRGPRSLSAILSGTP
ncbi:hypothetical protein KNU54_gp67 [Gordonia phage VanDeWege]|uniref:Uncharacterized protein n=2 Tax=Wizardvirus TaxID=2169658 RepID=A0A4Y5TYX4_9CAUD|nr:hypothetical protein KNU54_gp67 [Gordonia phage VanDeWege]YP_010103669.1 hypothetical protein KNU68_gp65 [Gordonia phage Nubi]QDB74649.1 hypothetical protein SEA_VANDEWEGE_67 [Gordonia phage VanDeWege]QDH85198.1 hypothetical protein SEA_NUBI_65 [Gordonia phage Nubi]